MVDSDYTVNGHLFLNGSPIHGSLVASGLASYISADCHGYKNFERVTVADLVRFHTELSGNYHIHTYKKNVDGTSPKKTTEQEKTELLNNVLRVSDISYPHKTRISELRNVSFRRLLIAMDVILYGIRMIFCDLILNNLTFEECQDIMNMIYGFSRKLDVTFAITLERPRYSIFNAYFDQTIVVGPLEIDASNEFFNFSTQAATNKLYNANININNHRRMNLTSNLSKNSDGSGGDRRESAFSGGVLRALSRVSNDDEKTTPNVNDSGNSGNGNDNDNKRDDSEDVLGAFANAKANAQLDETLFESLNERDKMEDETILNSMNTTGIFNSSNFNGHLPSSIRFMGRPEHIVNYFVNKKQVSFSNHENPLEMIFEHIHFNQDLVIDHLQDIFFQYRHKPNVLNPSNFDVGPRNGIFKELWIILKFMLMVGWREWSILYSCIRITIYGIIVGAVFFDISCQQLFLNVCAL